MMVAYTILMVVFAVVFLGLAVSVYRGNTDLIHDHHRTKVMETEREAYGKAFSKGLFGIAVTLFLSGVVALFGETMQVVIGAVGILGVGIVSSFVILWTVQKKFNQGLF